MCKHVLNAQVSIRAPCCRMWFDCPECHQDVSDHPLRKTLEMVFACKKCKKVFRKDMSQYEEQDEFCPHCDNQYVVEAKTPKMELGFETDDVRKDASFVRDWRTKQKTVGDNSNDETMEAYRRKMQQQLLDLDEAELIS